MVRKGLHFSRVHFGVSGSQQQMEEWEQWTWGLDHNDVHALISFLDSKKVGIAATVETHEQHGGDRFR